MATAVKETSAAPAGEYLLVPISKVVVDKGFNNRKELGGLEELAASIKSVGLLQPLLVRRDNGSFHLIAGERRLAASKLAGRKDVEVKIVDQDERQRLESLLVENLMRLDIDPLEEAAGYRRLVDLGLTQAEVAKKIGRSEAHISKRLALIGLSPLASKLLSAGKIPIEAAIALAKHAVDHQDRAIKAVQGNYGKIEDAAPYQLRNLGDRARDEAKKDARKKKRAELVKKLKADGVTILSAQNSYHWGEAGHPWRLGKPVKDSYRRESRVDLTPKQHAEFACHAAAVTSPGSIYDATEPAVVYLCTDPKAHMTKEQAAALLKKAKEAKHDSYEDQERRRKAVRDEIQAAQEARLPAIQEVLKGESELLFTLTLESFVMSANQGSIAAVLGLDVDKKGKNAGDVVAEFCNASRANLRRAAQAVALTIGEHSLAALAESHAGGYYFNRADLPQAIAVADFFEKAGIPVSEVERKALAKAKGKEKS
jgi:ParB/RepB/Spo0J family partition protein